MKQLYLYIIFIVNVIGLSAQDAVFSQYYSSTLYLNPALSAVEPSLTLNLNSRSQWRGIGEPFSTYQVSVIAPIKTKGILDENVGGVGGTVFSDRLGNGSLSTTGFYLSGGYILKLNNQKHLSFGLQGGYMIKSLDQDNFKWNSQYNEEIGWDENVSPGNDNFLSSKGVVDFSAGIFYYDTQKNDVYKDGRGLYLGFSAYHLNRSNTSLIDGGDAPLEMLLKAHGGVGLPIAKKMVLSPNFLVSSQGGAFQVNAGLYLDLILSDPATGIIPTNAYIGSWYRLLDSYILSLGLGNDSYTFGFSYDMNVSSLGQNLNNSTAYEISLKLRKPPKREIVYHQPRI